MTLSIWNIKKRTFKIFIFLGALLKNEIYTNPSERTKSTLRHDWFCCSVPYMYQLPLLNLLKCDWFGALFLLEHFPCSCWDIICTHTNELNVNEDYPLSRLAVNHIFAYS